MTLKELAKLTKSPIKILDARNGKTLCRDFKDQKHGDLLDREVLAVWAEMSVNNSAFTSFAKAYLCVYVEHREVTPNAT